MANVLGELFSEIAGSIRSGLGDIGAMKPSNFPDRIDEIVAVMNALANGSGGDGGEEGGTATGNGKVETGTFLTANTGVGRQYIKHTLGEIPDFVIVYALNIYSSGMDFSKNNFVAAWSVKSDLYSGGVKGNVVNTDSGSTMLGGLDVAIDNESVDLLSARIYCPDDSTIRVGTDKTDYGGQFGENTQYAWVAVSGMKKSVGSSADVRYVTFMSYDGTVEYGKKAVAVGDDCADPIARGVFAKPTRESDPQYNYTFYGWANEPNGGADENWNKSITEDKTVYANFSAAVRYYKIYYYDKAGDIVAMKSESLPYGSMPSYIPEKEGVGFSGWTPEPVPVTGNASYTAVWVENITFANASWSKIGELVASGEVSKYFAIGDTKDLEFNGEILRLAVADFNHDDLADGSGKAGMSLVLMSLPSLKSVWANDTTNRVYDSSVLKTNVDSWLTYLPETLQPLVKNVKKVINSSVNSGSGTKTVNCKLWPLSLSELGWTTTNSATWAACGYRYPIFPAVGGSPAPSSVPTITTKVNGIPVNLTHWIRQTQQVGVCRPGYIANTVSGLSPSDITSKEYPVRFGFCI